MLWQLGGSAELVRRSSPGGWFKLSGTKLCGTKLRRTKFNTGLACDSAGQYCDTTSPNRDAANYAGANSRSNHSWFYFAQWSSENQHAGHFSK